MCTALDACLPVHLSLCVPSSWWGAQASTLASHTQLTLSLSYLADRDTALAYQAYVTYIASPQAAGDYSTFRTAQTVAASSLSAIQADTLTLTSTPDSTVLSSASSVAQLVIGQQTPPAGVPLPPPQVNWVD